MKNNIIEILEQLKEKSQKTYEKIEFDDMIQFVTECISKQELEQETEKAYEQGQYDGRDQDNEIIDNVQNRIYDVLKYIDDSEDVLELKIKTIKDKLDRTLHYIFRNS